ncbi:MAG: hypothetical protein DRI97_08380 [Bacteroidetes bacterium]|nr:MAG: hypothetical protein DRI97_08380 [Bacteroidota bacterium]
MKSAILAKLHFIVIFFLTGHLVQAQIHPGELGGAEMNTIQTAVPFLTLAPDARASGLGDAGVASKADVNSQHWNVAKYAFIENRGGVSLSYTPWLRNLTPGINLDYLSGYYKINDENVVSSSFRYFSLGNITFTNISGHPTGSYQPIEFAIDAGYSRLLTDHFSGGLVFRYIRSDLTSGQTTADGQSTQAGTSIAGDIGLYYQNEVQMGSKEARWALGINLSNLGTPISYTADAYKIPIPSNLRLGGRFEYGINDLNSISIHADLNKLLVPTPPVYDTDTATGDLRVVRGKAPPESIVAGMFQSFADAPGVQKSYGEYSVFHEEMYEIAYSIGLEYNFRNLIAVRSGYFHEHAAKGNRKYLTFGLGVMNPYFSLELSYLAPTNGQDSPLANTFRVTFTSTFGRTTPLDPELRSTF